MKVIITGASGMVGEGVLHECLNHPDVESVLVIGRKHCGHEHPKLREIIHSDFFDLSGIREELKGYDACFFCLGVSSLGMKEKEYTRITYDLTLNFARTLVRSDPAMTFCYVSGVGTDSSEKGRVMWGRVKGKTENDLLEIGFRQACMFRPGFIKPTKGLKNTIGSYKVMGFLFPLFNLFFTRFITSQREVGLAMINCVNMGCSGKVLDKRDINELAQL